MSVLAQHGWLALPIAVTLSAGLAWMLIPLAVRLGWVDRPDARKVHEVATPPVGGLAIFVTLGIVTAVAPTPALLANPFFGYLLAGGLVLMTTGLIDDLHGLSAYLRFALQVLVCLLIIQLTGVRLDDFGRLFSGSVLQLGWLAVPITIFAAMGVINSFNLIDGMDGLSGAVFLVAAAGMALFAALAGQLAMLWFLLIAMSAVLGFMLLNARFPWNGKARVFLGDSGTLSLGLVLAWCFIRLGNAEDRAFMPMTAVWLFAVPLLDTSTQIRRRWREGRSAFSPDQNHLHHAFLRAGYSVGQSWAGITLLALALAAIGIALEFSRLPDCLSFYVFMAVAFAYYFYIKHCWASQSFLGRHFIHHDFDIEESFP